VVMLETGKIIGLKIKKNYRKIESLNKRKIFHLALTCTLWEYVKN